MTAHDDRGRVGRTRRQAPLVTVAVGLLAAALAVVADRHGEDTHREASAEPRRAIAEAMPSAPTTTTLPPTTIAAPVTTAGPVTSRPIPPRDDLDPRAAVTTSTAGRGAWTLGPYEGLGVWLDVYDWTKELTGGHPHVRTTTDLDRMAELGIQTIYIQTAHRRSMADVIEPDRLMLFIDRAHARGMEVVAWYLPTLEDVSVDLRRLVAASQLPVDGLGVDIESLAVADPAERNRRLLELSTRLRDAVGERPITAITPSAVHLQVVNPDFWPGFPWRELADAYDAILPMSYWSVRQPAWRSGERYVGENIDRIRASSGRPDIPIHVIGGIADGASVPDVQGMVRAIQSRGILGGSLYDWNTSQPAQWDALRSLRSG